MSQMPPSDLCKENQSQIARLEEKHASLDRLLEERDRRYASEWAAQRREVDIAFKAAEKAIEKSEQSQKEYNDKSNEFRQTLSDQNKTFLTFSFYTARHEDLIRRIDSLEKTRDEHYGGAVKGSENKKDSQWQITAIISAVSILVGILLGGFGNKLNSSPAPARVEVTNDERNKVPVKQ